MADSLSTSNTLLIQPTLTNAGRDAAFNAKNTGLSLDLTHMTYGIGTYAPTGAEVALTSEVSGHVPLVGASRPTVGQIRMISVWSEDTGGTKVTEVGWWAGDVLVFVYSTADGKAVVYKTDGVPFVMHSDLSLVGLPTGVVNIIVDTSTAPALAALAAHEGSADAHPQYVLWSRFPDAMSYLAAKTVAGTANAIQLTLGTGIDLADGYQNWQNVRFKAVSANTGVVTVSVNGQPAVPIFKTGGDPLDPSDIRVGGVYDLVYQGNGFQLMGSMSTSELSGALTDYKEYVDETYAKKTDLSDAMADHLDDPDPHTQYATKQALSAATNSMGDQSRYMALALFNQGYI
jgi:hypothetical protein